jgi:ribosomal protein S18 acetylase RimI-like enzyme
MNAEVEIVKPVDYSSIAREIFDIEQQVRPGLYEPEFAEAFFKDDWKPSFEYNMRLPGSVCLVAKHGKHLVGYVRGRLDPEEPYFSELSRIAVVPDYQGCGIGTELRRHFLDIAKKRRCKFFYEKTKEPQILVEQWGARLWKCGPIYSKVRFNLG